MKTNIRILSIMLFAIIMTVVSCSKDKGPEDSDFFVGTYHGSITYTDGEDTVTDTDGRVTVIKVGTSYTFDFGSGIPNITGVKFKKNEDNTYGSIGDGLTGITVSASSLNILVINDKGTWTANCSR